MRFVCEEHKDVEENLGKVKNNEEGEHHCYVCGNGYVDRLWPVLEHAKPASYRRKFAKRVSFTNLDPDKAEEVTL